jgi:hypothetical protein
MTCLLKKVLPFVLALSLGIALGRLITHSNLRSDIAMVESPSSNSMPLSISYVPELDFTDAARRTIGFSGSLKLRALLDADGKVSEVEPAVMLPYGVTDEASVETGRMGHPAPAIMDGKFVKTLPYGMTESAIESAKQIRFTPAMKDGKPTSSLITITYEFNLSTSPDCMCSSITTTIMDDSGVKWHKPTWRENTYYYRTHPDRRLIIK